MLAPTPTPPTPTPPTPTPPTPTPTQPQAIAGGKQPPNTIATTEPRAVVEVEQKFPIPEKNNSQRRLLGLEGDEEAADADDVKIRSAEVRRLLTEAQVVALMDPVLEKVYGVPDRIYISSATKTGSGYIWSLAFDIIMPAGVATSDAATTNMIQSITQKTAQLQDPTSALMTEALSEMTTIVQTLGLPITVPTAAQMAAVVQLVKTPSAVDKEVVIYVAAPPVPAPLPPGLRSGGPRAFLNVMAAAFSFGILLTFT